MLEESTVKSKIKKDKRNIKQNKKFYSESGSKKAHNQC